jgi:bilirubin oxidase
MKKIIVILSGVFSIAFGQNPLAIPDTLSGTLFNLNIYDTSRVFYAGFVTNTYGVNAAYLGPTIFLRKGDSVSLNVNNTLADTTTIHWHGLHVSAANDGGPHTVIPPATVWNPRFKVRDEASTFWYHPHLHMNTNLHATKGAAGIIIVRDSSERTLALPRTYGTDDFPVVIQSKAFDGNKQIMVNNAYDSVMMVNGTLKPYLQVPAQVVRLRLLNASSERVYNCGFTGNFAFYQIASGGGLLANPVSLTRLRLAPGERAEILLNLTGMQTQTLNLISFASEFGSGIYGAANPAAMGGGTITGYSTNVLNGTNFPILNLQVVAQTTNAVTSIPSSLKPNSPWNTALAAVTRTLTFSPQTMGANQMLNGPFLINSSSFNMGVVNYTIPKDNIEIWQLTNNTAIAHPFHIHDVQFYLFSINGATPPANMQGRKDVVLVPSQQTVKFITRFETFCDSIPYMYHCHMLKHED